MFNHTGRALPRQAPDSDNGANAETETEGTGDKRKQVAKHELLGPTGDVVKRMEEATGIRYTLIESGDTFEWQAGQDAGSALVMLALFGAKTKATNEASRIRNGSPGGGADEQMSAIDEVFEQLAKGVWREKAEGTGGSRIDKAKLAQALVNVLGDKAKQTVGQYQARLEEEEAYFKQVRQHPEVRAEYTRLVGKAVAAVDTLA